MKTKLGIVVGLASLVTAGELQAGTCRIASTRPYGDWTFIKVYDPDKNEIILQKAMMGGTAKEVTVSGTRVRVDWKLAGGIKYKAGAVTTCKGGNTVKV